MIWKKKDGYNNVSHVFRNLVALVFFIENYDCSEFFTDMQPAQRSEQAGCLIFNLHDIYYNTHWIWLNFFFALYEKWLSLRGVHQSQMSRTGSWYLLGFYPRDIASVFDEWCSNFIPIKCDKSAWFFCRDCKGILKVEQAMMKSKAVLSTSRQWGKNVTAFITPSAWLIRFSDFIEPS